MLQSCVDAKVKYYATCRIKSCDSLLECMCVQGLKRSDQSVLIDSYRAKAGNTSSGASQPVFTAQAALAPLTASSDETSRIRKLEKLIKRL